MTIYRPTVAQDAGNSSALRGDHSINKAIQIVMSPGLKVLLIVMVITGGGDPSGTEKYNVFLICYI
ncbi:hypothetical protein D8V81_23175 [Salmonella enterica]|nr:hypothetical protein [Salmonella enterica]